MIEQLSVSQVETFDDTQRGGCELRWWFDAKGLKGDQKKSQVDGEALHAHLARYLKTGEPPKKRTLMSKAAMGAIVKGELPKPGPDLLVEERFDGQDKFGPDGVTWLPLDRANTFWLGGVPFDGFIDLAFRRGDVPEVWDHKTSTDIHANSKPASGLIKTVQMPVYVLSQIPYWPDAKRWRIVHHNVSRTGIDSLIRGATVDIDQVLERKAQIETVIERMKLASDASDQGDVKANTRSCEEWGGCAHQAVCSAFKRRNIVTMTREEEELFAQFDAELEPAEPTPAPQPPPEEPRKRKMLIVDGNPPPDVPTPTPATPAPEPEVSCACGAKVTSENGSKLQSGEWKHISCPLDAPPAEPKARRAKKAPEPKPEPVAEAPISPQESKPEVPFRAPTPEPEPKPAAPKPPPLVKLTMPNERTDAIAGVLESIAKLLRT